MIFEVVAGFLVGLTAGLITITWPQDLCFLAIGIAVMVDYLRGFAAVFAVMETMSSQILSGAADLIEAVVFSFLISASLGLGLFVAETIMRVPAAESSIGRGGDVLEERDYLRCVDAVDERWYYLVVVLASVSWPTLFKPQHKDLSLMVVHTILAYVVNYFVEKGTGLSYLALLVAAFVLSSSAALVSRFTGRQSLTDVYAGKNLELWEAAFALSTKLRSKLLFRLQACMPWFLEFLRPLAASIM